MAEVKIPLQRFVERSLAGVCAVTGVPAEEQFAFTFDGVTGGLPLNGSSVRLVRQQQLTLRVLAVTTLGLFIIAAALQSVLIGFGAMATAAIVLANFAALRSRLPRGHVDGKHLVLTNVHQAFVDALSEGAAPGKCAGCPTAQTCDDQDSEPADSAVVTRP